MPRKPEEKTCCVCLNNVLNLNRLSKKDENKVNLMKKLQTCISEIEWLSSYHICDPCTNLLNIVYTFRETCIRSDFIRKQKFEEIKGEIKKDEPSFYKEPEVTESDEIKNETTYGECEGISDDQDDDDDDDSNDPNYSNESESEEKPDSEPDKTGHKQTRKKRRHSQFTCEKCSSMFNTSTKLVEHCVDEHDMNLKDVRPFICDRCPSRFCNSSNLVQHIKYHDAVRSSTCTFCGKGFITKTDLNIHEKQHLNRREYKCEICGKCFNTHKDIRSHKLVVHTDSNRWKYQCEICNKPFPIKSNYDSHMRRHTGDKKFECHLCEKKFTDKCVLQRHMRTHSNVREYKCQHCDKEYKDARVMKVHMAKVHGIGLGKIKLPSKERKYICHICPKAYYAKNKLTRHLYTHSGEKPYVCPICGKKFNDKSYVKQHLRKTHNVDADSQESDTTKFEFKPINDVP